MCYQLILLGSTNQLLRSINWDLMHFAHQLGRSYSYQATAGTLAVQLGSGMCLAIFVTTDY